jgi:phage shock protein E
VTGEYLLPGLIIAVVVWRALSSFRARRMVPGLLQVGAQIVDVRSAGEFAAGHDSRSRNIPLDDLARGANDLDRSKCVIVCCASGTRSAIAGRHLRRQGFARVLNAGSWRNLP